VVAPDVGLVYGSPRHTIPDRGWWSVHNARFLRGNAEKVPGFVQHASLDGPVMGMYHYVTPSGFERWMYATRTTVYADDGSGPSAVGTLTGEPNSWVKWVTYRGTLIFTNGKDPVKKWTGSGPIADLGGNPPKAKSIAVFQNHVVLAWLDPGLPTEQPQTLQWSDIGNAEVWSGGLENGKLTLSDEPTGVIEIAQLRDSLVAYKPDAIYLIDYTGFPFTMSTRRISSGGLGPISSRSVVAAQDVHYFLAEDGNVYKLTMAGPELISQAVGAAIRRELNYALKDSIFGFLNLFDNEAVWVIPTGSSPAPNVAYILNLQDSRWGRRELRATSSAFARTAQTTAWDDLNDGWDSAPWIWDDSSLGAGSPMLLHGDDSGKVYRLRGFSADGAPIVMSLETKMFDLGDATRKKRLKRLHLHYDATPGAVVKIYVLTASSPNGPTTSYGPYDMVLTGSGDDWIDVDVTGTWFAFRFVNEDTDKYVRITGYIPVFHVREVT